MKIQTLSFMVALAIVASGCKDNAPGKGGGDHPTASSKTAATGSAAVKSVKAKPVAGAMDCSTPRKTIASQVALIQKGGKVALFAQCFTDRQRGKITQAMLDKAHKEASHYKLEELYGSEKKASDTKVKVKMKNGRTLTTLMRKGDVWQADTLWFK